MKKFLMVICLCVLYATSYGQVSTLAPGNYKSIVIQNYSTIGDFTRALILLHEAYNGTLVNANYAVGTIIGLRGANYSMNRFNVAEIKSASSYNSTTANISSIQNEPTEWKLKTCIFNGKKYLALDIPYIDPYHDQGYKFVGWTVSTGENMLAVPYMVSGSPVNQSVLSNIQDFLPNQTVVYSAQDFNILANVGIGTTNTQGHKLAVKGSIAAESVKVALEGSWPDYVFSKDYRIPSLEEIEKHILLKGHLPGIPSAKEVKASGINLGEMNAKLLEKLEEMTLHLIEQNKKILTMEREVKRLKNVSPNKN